MGEISGNIIVKTDEPDTSLHIKAYAQLFLLKHYSPQVSEKLQQLLVIELLEINAFWYAPDKKVWENVLDERYRPKNKYMVHELKRIGYSQTSIAELLGITQSAVSYALVKPLKNGYFNVGMFQIQRKINIL